MEVPMPTWILALKDLRLLVRDPKAAIILLAMPFLFILVLGMSLGEGFGQKPDDRLRISLVDLDQGYVPAKVREGLAWFVPAPPSGSLVNVVAAAYMAQENKTPSFPPLLGTWAERVKQDLAQTAGIRIELIASREEAQRLVNDRRRAAVLVFGPRFSERVARSSFLADGINPFFREGVYLKTFPEKKTAAAGPPNANLDVELHWAPTQLTAASIIEQVAQVSLLRVVLPWMIGQAFAEIGQPEFIDRLSKNDLQVPLPLVGDLSTVLKRLPPPLKQQVAKGLQRAIQDLYPNYKLTAKTWASLTMSKPFAGKGAETTSYQPVEGTGLLNRGAARYQLLVPSYIVMFAFFLVLTMGWLFVGERRQGTLKRLRAAPLARVEILLGKMIPCFLLSVAQGLLLLGAGRLVFGMSWGPHPIWLFAVVLCTSLAAMGLAMLVAALARTETQVSIFGTLLVLMLAGVSGCLMGDRELMPEQMQDITRVTPHAWALDAYRELLTAGSAANLVLVAWACIVLASFSVVFTGLAWWTLRLE
jgi:ABC-type Na+ efflux pump permease subunit